MKVLKAKYAARDDLRARLEREAEALRSFDRGGLEVLQGSKADFDRALRQDNHTLKRALTDPRIISGVGNAYSDEILHAARLSPFKQTGRLEDEEVERLYAATVEVGMPATYYVYVSVPSRGLAFSDQPFLSLIGVGAPAQEATEAAAN